jgi:16S rRNA C967 or C1407 C5-methylase (RsmB/RsmF family)/NOL1/NOP2/fmu family ribosome biogenesis protein
VQLPEILLKSLEDIQGFDRQTFEKVHSSGEQITSIRINPFKLSESWQVPSTGGNLGEAVPWSQYGYYLDQRPSFTFDPLFHAGCYYVQEASSMFLEQALQQTVDLSQPLKVLDLCGAPGGKSTHIQSLISKESLLVTNEVIKNRVSVLVQNITKWGCDNVIVTHNDPIHFTRLEGYFDVIIIDAPCSGSGLFRKDAEAVSEWSLNNVALCSQRQQRILADALPSLKTNGILIYSTCSYSKEEDEEIGDWLVEEFKMENKKLKIDQTWGIVETFSSKKCAVGYRFFPDKLKGEGFFLSCFKKTNETNALKRRTKRIEQISKQEQGIIEKWISEKNFSFFYNHHSIYALPENLIDDYSFLQQYLNVYHAGVSAGQVLRDKFIPGHGLALSKMLSSKIPSIELTFEEAIKFLQKNELHLTLDKHGWQVVSYKHYTLGWINALSNRINNYYPKELRILKRYNGFSSGK